MIRERLRNFMIGRYGPDQLNMALIVCALVIGLVSSFSGIAYFNIAAYALLVWAFVRLLSRNIAKRRAENDRFLRFWSPLKQRAGGRIRRMKASKDYKFFKCPSCGNMLRVPKGKGKVQITCPKCGERFIKKT